MSLIEADLGALDALAQRLSGVARELPAAAPAAHLTPAQVGDPDLSEAVLELSRRWRRGLQATADGAAEAAARLHTAVDRYAELDQAIAGAAQ